jgi:metal-responsive CopG/Arc/MetJ family transcriptional regulator
MTKKRPPGRPRIMDSSVTVSACIPGSHARKLERLMKQKGWSRSEALREIIDAYFGAEANHE